MSKQSSIEWFYQRILAKDINEVFEQAKAMHKEEIEEAYDHHRCIGNFENGEQYYNETFNQ
jgi:CRISPR/Cas system-associated protein Cas10 (large subunit of type III CRISPR-Cas system)